jgi:hypothetical protein
MDLDYSKAFALMDIEVKCIKRNSAGKCDRQCEKCDLVQKDSDLLEAYEVAQYCILQMMRKS